MKTRLSVLALLSILFSLTLTSLLANAAPSKLDLPRAEVAPPITKQVLGTGTTLSTTLYLPIILRSPISLERLGQLGGVTYGIAVSGSRAYMGIGPRLVIFDVSNPAHPFILGQSHVLGAFVRDVTIVGSYAYVANGVAGLHIFNISNPAAPVEIGSYDTPGWTVDVVIVGNHAYVADGDNGLLIFDITNPASPALVGRYATSGTVGKVAVAGKYAFVNLNDTLQMIDISDPTHPHLVRSYQITGSFGDVAAAGNYVYTTSTEYDPQDPFGDWWSALRVFYVVENPLILAPVSETRGISGVNMVVQGNYAYLNSAIVDISDPTHPIQTGVYPGTGSNGLAVAGTYAYVTGDSQSALSLLIINVSNPNAPTGVGFYQPPVNVIDDLEIVRGYVYLPGLRVVDISQPTAPTALGVFNLPFGHMVVMGDYAYVPRGDSLRVWNVSNPITPTEIATLNTRAYDVATAGNYAYVPYVAWVGGMNVFDISNPISPTQVGHLDLPSSPTRRIVVNGHYAYLTGRSYSPELSIVDISNPLSPTEVSHLLMDPGYPPNYMDVQIAVTGNYAILYDITSGTMYAIDVSDPISPTIVASRTYGGTGMAVAGNYAYVANGGSGVRVINIANPVTPTEAFVYNTPGDARNVRASGNTIYVADREGGLLVLHLRQ